MNEIYFIDETHKSNYETMLVNFPIALRDKEYHAACYIASAPTMFYKYQEHLNEHDTPVDWFIHWQYKNLPQDEAETEEDFIERFELGSYVNYDLTTSMQRLGELALNLWNGYEHFNLMDCLNSVDDNNYRVLRCAMNIRMGLF